MKKLTKFKGNYLFHERINVCWQHFCVYCCFVAWISFLCIKISFTVIYNPCCTYFLQEIEKAMIISLEILINTDNNEY